MKIRKIHIFLSTVITLFAAETIAQSCQTATKPVMPELPKFDANYAGCYNYYAVDLGIEEANKKCKILSKIQDFSEPSFAACNQYLQPSRAEWKAAIADRCLDLSKKFKFQTKSFQSCVDYFSISIDGRNSAAKKLKIEAATLQCIDRYEQVDYSSKSFISCFSLYGGNRYPLGKKEAESSVEIAAYCSEKVKTYDFSNRRLYDCWDKNRILKVDRKLMVDNCVEENPITN